MTPKEKAKKLLKMFLHAGTGGLPKISYTLGELIAARECTAKCVNEILDVLNDVGVYPFADPEVEQFWEAVRSEILEPTQKP